MISNKSTWSGLCLAVLGSVATQAAVVLTVDVSNPAAVVLTATGANASTSVSSDVFNGFTLSGFFTADANAAWAGSSLSAGLTGGDASLQYDVSNVDTDSPVGLFIAHNGNEAMTFSSSAAAFSGSAAFDLSSASLLLPAGGTTGSLVVWDTGFNAVEIGTWQITPVPEPSSYVAIAGFGLVGFSAYRRVRGSRR